MKKFYVYRQGDKPHYVNEYGCLECCKCEPMSESDYESDSSSGDDPNYIPGSSGSDSDKAHTV